MGKQNYSLYLENVIKENLEAGIRPKLLLQVCCAPCSSSVLEYINKYFDITLYYYNPNISPETEYRLRYEELKKFVAKQDYKDRVDIVETGYEHEEFLKIAKGLEREKEGGERCKKCYRLRLRKTAERAKKEGFDYFTTTLSVSPYKNAEWLNGIGKELEDEFGVNYLFSDFKKKEGYKRSIELSRKFGLYRQDYCGCAYSKAQSLEKDKQI